MFAVSYDGRTGDKTYGAPLPDSLGLTHLEIEAGRSTQSTLLGRDDITYESLYLSPELASLAMGHKADSLQTLVDWVTYHWRKDRNDLTRPSCRRISLSS